MVCAKQGSLFACTANAWRDIRAPLNADISGSISSAQSFCPLKIFFAFEISWRVICYGANGFSLFLFDFSHFENNKIK